VLTLADVVHFGLLSPPPFQAFKSYDTRHIVFCTFFDCLLSGFCQPSHPARIFSGILLGLFYLLLARRLPAHVTLLVLQYFCVTGDGKTLREVTVEIVFNMPKAQNIS